MNAFEGIKKKFDEEILKSLKSNYAKIDALNQDVAIYFRRLREVIQEYQETGYIPPLQEFENWEDMVRNAKSKEKNANEDETQKENVEPQNAIQNPTSIKRLRRNVKKEKQSLATVDEVTVDLTEDLQNSIKKEETKSPTQSVPKKRRNAKNKVQVKQEKLEKELEEKVKESDVIIQDPDKVQQSDVIIQDPDISVVNLLDSSNEEEKNQTVIQDKGTTDETQEINSNTEETEQNNNATFISASRNNQNNFNATIVVENPKYVRNLIPEITSDMMTDDESEEEVKKLPKEVSQIPKLKKQIFSEFEQTPVKIKIEAFEKLTEGANDLPPMTTKTKTRAQQKEELDRPTTNLESKNIINEKVKMSTPVTSKFLPKAASTGVKSTKVIPSMSNESTASGKTASALKASQAEYRERERLRREREEASLKKREAIIQAQMEEKKRRLEEKQLKAQQLREAKKKEKLKFLEALKLKEERHKQLLAEQEQKKLKQKEESEKKRKLTPIKATEEKKKQNNRDAEASVSQEHTEEKKDANKNKKPEYLISKAPLLPTEDCYDSDDEHPKHAVTLPNWLQKQNLRYMLECANDAGTAYKNKFFSVQAQTPDLENIFEVIQPAKLKRTSSAIWHKIPRFSLMPKLETHEELSD